MGGIAVRLHLQLPCPMGLGAIRRPEAESAVLQLRPVLARNQHDFNQCLLFFGAADDEPATACFAVAEFLNCKSSYFRRQKGG